MMKPSISFREMSTAWTWPRKQVEGGAGDTGLQEGGLEDGEDFRWSVVGDGDGAVEMLELGGNLATILDTFPLNPCALFKNESSIHSRL